MEESEEGKLEVFASGIVVINDSFLEEVCEDKSEYINRIALVAKVTIDHNNKGSYIARGNWKKILALEEILKDSLRRRNSYAGMMNKCSYGSYAEVVRNVLTEECQRKGAYSKPDLEVIPGVRCLEKSDTVNHGLISRCDVTSVSAENKSIISGFSSGSRSGNGLSTSEDEGKNGNEIYVNITLSTMSTSEELSYATRNALFENNVKSEKLNIPRLSANIVNEEGTLHSKVLSKKYQKKLYEQQTPFKYFCSICSFKSKRESHYQKHLLLHKQVTTKLFVCAVCGFRTIRLGHLRRHGLQHASQSLTCSICPYTTDSAALLQRHQRIKHPFIYNQHHIIKFHGETVKKKTPSSYQCDKCVYKTKRKEHFDRHQRDVHSEVRPFLCHICGRAFKRSDALKQHHAATHRHDVLKEDTASNPSYPTYCCPACSKPCRSRAHLREHLMTHSDKRSFLCEICGSSFKTRAVQRKHMLTVHINPKAFPCNLCVRRFSTKYALLRHLKIHGSTKDDNSMETAKAASAILNCTRGSYEECCEFHLQSCQDILRRN